jgi:DNA-binding transcriptional regulator YbjK
MHRRHQLADAAIHVLANAGVRQLTHRAVDAQAGLAQGSTSNVFRTRAALIDGVLTRLIERERAVLDTLQYAAAGPALSQAQLADLAAAMVLDALGRGREHTLARRALFADAAQHQRVSEQLERASQYWWDLVSQLLHGLGVPDEHRRARWLLAYIDGTISDQLARPAPDFDPRAALDPAIHGILNLA